MRTLFSVDDDDNPPVAPFRRAGVMCVLEQFQQEPARVLVGGVPGGGAQLCRRIPHVGRRELGEHRIGIRNDLVARRQRCVVPVTSENSHERKGMTTNGTMPLTAVLPPETANTMTVGIATAERSDGLSG